MKTFNRHGCYIGTGARSHLALLRCNTEKKKTPKVVKAMKYQQQQQKQNT